MSVKSKTAIHTTKIDSDKSIDFSDSPLITEERARKGWIRLPDGTRIVPVRMDSTTFQWYLSQGKDFTQQLETVLREHAAAQLNQLT